MQYLDDLLENFEDIKKRKFKLSESVNFEAFRSTKEVSPDALIALVQENHKRIIGKYRLDLEVYLMFFQNLLLSQTEVLYPKKDTNGILTGEMIPLSQEEFINKGIIHSFYSLFNTLTKDKMSTYEKILLKSNFVTFDNYVGINCYGLEDLCFVFGDSQNVIKSILNSIKEKYKVEFTGTPLKDVLNFQSNQFFDNLSVNNILSLDKIKMVYSQVADPFKMDLVPVHVSDLFYIDLMALAESKYAIDLVSKFSGAQRALKTTLGLDSIEIVAPAELASQKRIGVGKNAGIAISTLFRDEEIFDKNILKSNGTTQSINLNSKTYINTKSVLIGTKFYSDFSTLLDETNPIGIQAELYLRQFLSLSPDYFNTVKQNLGKFHDFIGKLFEIPFKANVYNPETDESKLEYPFKLFISNLLKNIKEKCTYEEIYELGYKFKMLRILSQVEDEKYPTDFVTSFMKNKVCEFLVVSKISEEYFKNNSFARIYLSMLLVMLGGSKDTGQVSVISDLDSSKNYIFRTNELVNIIVRPFLNADPTLECIFNNNTITFKTIGYQLSLVFNIQNFDTLKVSLLSTKNTIEKLARTQFKSIQVQRNTQIRTQKETPSKVSQSKSSF